MGPAAQSLEHSDRVVDVAGFSENLIVDCDQSIGAEDDLLWMRTSRGHRFARRVQSCQFTQREIGIKPLGYIRRACFEFESSVQK
jgi:hypothetical protein